MDGMFSEVCYVVHDVEEAIERWSRVTGAGPFFTMTDSVAITRTNRGKPAEDTFIAALGFMGATLFELFQPTNGAPSIFREILDVKGEALHHVYPNLKALTPEEFDAAHDHYLRLGLQPAADLLVEGLGRNVFFDGLEQYGCFFELLELQPETMRLTEKMHTIHMAWDRRRPMREYAELIA